MAIASQGAIKQLSALMDEVDAPLKATFQDFDFTELLNMPVTSENISSQNMHQGYPTATLVRFLKAREWSVPKAHKMLVDCLNWRMQNQIDDILKKPIIPADLYRGVRDSQLVGLSGYSNEGLPVFAIGVGLSTFDKALVNYYVQSHIQINEYRDRVILPAATKKYGRHIGTCVKVLDMTGLKLSALSHIKLLTIISTVDDRNYPEKTQTYYVVNAPYVFSACWKVVKPLLQERTRRKVQVLQGCGRDELLKIMDYASLPHFCRKESLVSSRIPSAGADDSYSLDHPFHQQLYNYIKQQALSQGYVPISKQGSLHVDVPVADTAIASELRKIGDHNGLACSVNVLRISGA